MPKLTVNGNEVEFEDGMTVLQACEIAGEEIPRFCYHDRLQIAGNCRMCLVQIEGGPPKPAASCAMPAGDGMIVHTNSPMVKKAREGVMEFLLINHPLDCPICDQGGECDLQDQAMSFGCGESRFTEKKRSVKDKSFGPLIKPHMTRCIHCTRCIRFMTDVAGVEEMGATGRGEDMEVGTFIEKNISSELSGNIIDLCPVGALTSKPYAFKARSWELKKTESIDVLDAVGSNIRVDSRGKEVMRILPRLNDDVNEEWISDKTRFSYDGLKNQRLDRPYIKDKGKFVEATWEEAIDVIARKIKSVQPKEIAAIAGDMADGEAMLSLKELMENIGSQNIDCRQDGANISNENRAGYLFNSTIAGIDEADACLLVGVNPRYEASIINSRLRKRVLAGGFEVASIGQENDLTYKVNNLGQHADIIEQIRLNKNPFSKALTSAKKPMIIVGSGVLTRDDSDAILKSISDICDKFGVVKKGWNGFNILHTAASRVAGLDLGFVPGKGGKNTSAILKSAEKGDIKFVYLLGADEIDMSAFKKSFVVYQGHHGDAGAHGADVILPGAAYTEKNATYTNLEGRVQQTKLSIFPPGEAKEDWKIISLLARRLDLNSYESLSDVRAKMVEIAPAYKDVGQITPAEWKAVGKKGKVKKTILKEAIGLDDFYTTNPISRASETIAKCVDAFVAKKPARKTKKEAA